tara:strand:- start:540 stop:887 length:348 start_codon:yes stop_codon:yes gene_type:complete
MSFSLIAWSVKQNTGCSGSKLVLIQLCNYADETKISYPSYAHLSKICCCSKASIQRYVKKLVQNKFIKVVKIGKGIRKHNQYEILCSDTVVNLTTNTNINKFKVGNTKNKNFIAG